MRDAHRAKPVEAPVLPEVSEHVGGYGSAEELQVLAGAHVRQITGVDDHGKR